MLDERKDTEVAYDRPDLTKEKLNDIYQRLFIELVQDHAAQVLQHLDDPGAVPPLRLYLLGTAGTGKTTAVQTLLQELKRILRGSGIENEFVRVAAYTGCAAYNVRFGASTLHRLFDMRNPVSYTHLTLPTKRIV